MAKLVKWLVPGIVVASSIGAIALVMSLTWHRGHYFIDPPAPEKLLGSYAITHRSYPYMRADDIRGQGVITFLENNVFKCSGGKLEVVSGEHVLETIIPEGSTGGEWQNDGEFISLNHNVGGDGQWTTLRAAMIHGELVLVPNLDPDLWISCPLFRTELPAEAGQ